MTTMDLFAHKKAPQFEKTAATAKAASAQLDEDTSSWAGQILTELFRSTPEVSDYTPRVEMFKIDGEQGYGLGVVVVENTTDSALAVARVGPSAKRVLVPVVIRNHTLCPLDLLMLRNGKMMPLNGHTLREGLFRPETFELTTEDHGDTSLYNQFYPPGRSDNDFGAGMSQGMGGGAGNVTFIQGPGMKMSADYQLLSRLAGTYMAPDLDGVAKVAASIELDQGSAFFGALTLLASAEEGALKDASGALKLASTAAPPDVLQFGFDEDSNRYWMKKASRRAFAASHPLMMSRGEALKIAGSEVVSKVDTEGVVTLSPTPVKPTSIDLDASTWEEISKPGIYKVKTVHGKEQVGWVIPNLMDLDGTRVPMAVFTNGASAMVQGTIVGAHIASGVDLPAGPAKGTGVFYCAGQGGVIATVPLLVKGSEGGMEGGHSYLVKSLTGEEGRVRLVPGLQKMVVLKDEFHLPASAKFLPLSDEQMTPLVDTVPAVTKTAADMGRSAITLYGGDDAEVSVRFQAMPKLASVTSTRLSHEDAAFLLVLAGTTAVDAHTKIAQASTGNTIEVPGLVDVRLAQDLIDQTRKTASDRSHEVMALRRGLVKEAASLPDAMTVDAVLSLGFINSENVRTFVSNIPYLEKCLSKTCELVLAGRLGLSEIPEFASARAARALDEVILGLKALALRDVQEGASTGN